MVDQTNPEELTFVELIKDIGWFPMLLIGLGGFSTLAIIEQGILGEPLQLVQVLQWPLDGFHRAMRLLGSGVEPLIQPVLGWLNAALGWSLTLNPIWRPLFALGMVFAMGFARASWQEGERGKAIYFGLAFGGGALIGAAIAGLAPAEAGWAAQGVRAGAPIAGLFAVFLLAHAAREALQGKLTEAGKTLAGASLFLLIFGGAGYAVAAGLSLVPGLSHAAGILTLGGFVALIGLQTLSGGLGSGNNQTVARVGLTILGGFFAAGMILVADWGLKMLGVG